MALRSLISCWLSYRALALTSPSGAHILRVCALDFKKLPTRENSATRARVLSQRSHRERVTTHKTTATAIRRGGRATAAFLGTPPFYGFET